MIRNIVSNEKRELYFVDERGFIQLCDVVGVQGEKNAEIFHISVPLKINGVAYDSTNFNTYDWFAITENESNGYQEYRLQPVMQESEAPSYLFGLQDVHTVDPTLRFGLTLRTKDGHRIWDSEIVEFRFLPNANIDAESVIRKAVIKINYDKLYDMLYSAGGVVPERIADPTQADVDVLIEIAREEIAKEDVPQALKDALYQTFGDPTFFDVYTPEDLIAKIEEYPQIFGNWVHQIAIDTYPITEYGVSGTASYKELKSDIEYIIQALADNIWQMVTGLPIPSTHVDWQTVKDVIEDYPEKIRQECSDELGNILNTITGTTDFSNLTWEEIKVAIQVFVPKVEESAILPSVDSIYNILVGGNE